MPWIERTALALLAFAFLGLGLIFWQPEGRATVPERHPAYFLVISSGAGMKLSDSATRLKDGPTLSCDKVFSLGPVDIGARCVSHGWEVTIER
ncbi:MAG: hypothetical protein K0U74_11500 [Alphaproteobacteria bacterium]|nr:hypothetical protein [Alphaproteobacteria bacterium]